VQSARSGTRVVASCNGAPIELALVRELAGGDILLILRNARHRVKAEGKIYAVHQQRYRLHLDPTSRRVFIKHAFRTANDRIISTGSLTSASADIRAWPVVSRLLPAHAPRLSRYRDGPSHTDVELGAFNPLTQSLCYSVVAHRHQKVALSRGRTSVSHVRLPFREFEISIMATIVDRPAAEGGLMHHNLDTLMEGGTNDVMAESDLVAFAERAASLLTSSLQPPKTSPLFAD